MTTWSAVTWDTARAGGFAAYILLSVAVSVGLVLRNRWQTPKWPRLITNELHGYLSLLALVFIVVHVLAVLVDPFTRFGLAEVLVPFVSHYRPVWMGLGIVALYLLLAVWLSSRLRTRIGYETWRRIHVLAYGVYVAATIHGLGTGSDTRSVWAPIVYASSVVVVGGLAAAPASRPRGTRAAEAPRARRRSEEASSSSLRRGPSPDRSRLTGAQGPEGSAGNRAVDLCAGRSEAAGEGHPSGLRCGPDSVSREVQRHNGRSADRRGRPRHDPDRRCAPRRYARSPRDLPPGRPAGRRWRRDGAKPRPDGRPDGAVPRRDRRTARIAARRLAALLQAGLPPRGRPRSLSRRRRRHRNRSGDQSPRSGHVRSEKGDPPDRAESARATGLRPRPARSRVSRWAGAPTRLPRGGARASVAGSPPGSALAPLS